MISCAMHSMVCLQFFNTVGRRHAEHPTRKELNVGVLVVLIWPELGVNDLYYWFSPLPFPSCLAAVMSRLVWHSGTDQHRMSWKRAVKRCSVVPGRCLLCGYTNRTADSRTVSCYCGVIVFSSRFQIKWQSVWQYNCFSLSAYSCILLRMYVPPKPSAQSRTFLVTFRIGTKFAWCSRRQ